MRLSIVRRHGAPILIACAALLMSIAHAQTNPERQILGAWLTQAKDGVIEIYLTGTGKLEGKIVGGRDGSETLDVNNPDPALRSHPLRGTVMLRGFRYAGAGTWTDGTIYDPHNGKTYECNITLTQPDTLKIRGYVGVPLFGRTEMWVRKK